MRVVTCLIGREWLRLGIRLGDTVRFRSLVVVRVLV